MAQANALVSAFDQSWKIGHNKAALVFCFDHAQIRDDRREMIFSDFWFCSRNNRQQRRFSDTWESDKPGIRQHFQLQDDIAFKARFAFFRKLWRRICRRCETRVSTAAAATFCDDCCLPMFHQISNGFTGIHVFNDCARRNFDQCIFSFGTVLVLAHAVCSAFGFKDPFVAEIHQRAQSFFNDKDDISAFAAISAGRAAVRYIFFAAECNHAIPAVATFNINFYVIDKHIIPPSVRAQQSMCCFRCTLFVP